MRINGRLGRGHRHGGRHGDGRGPGSHGLLAATATRSAVYYYHYYYDEAEALVVMATRKFAVSYEPPIYSGTGVRASQVSAGNGSDGDRGDVLVHVFDLAEAVLSRFLLGSTVHVRKLLSSGYKPFLGVYVSCCADRRRRNLPQVVLFFSGTNQAGQIFPSTHSVYIS